MAEAKHQLTFKYQNHVFNVAFLFILILKLSHVLTTLNTPTNHQSVSMSKALKAVLKVEEALTAWEERAVAPAAAYTASQLLLQTIPSLIGGTSKPQTEEILISLSTVVEQMYLANSRAEMKRNAKMAHLKTQQLSDLLSNQRSAG